MAEILLPPLPADLIYVAASLSLAHIGNPRSPRPLCGRRKPPHGFVEIPAGDVMALCPRCEFAQYGAAGSSPGSAP